MTGSGIYYFMRFLFTKKSEEETKFLDDPQLHSDKRPQESGHSNPSATVSSPV